MFYCMFYFTCDLSFRTIVDAASLLWEKVEQYIVMLCSVPL